MTTAGEPECVESFETVFDRELNYISARRRACSLASPAEPGDARSNGDDLCGLAMSGGGIRSAIFNLGVLQALQSFGALPRIDYISTVSGGGYIGTCLSVLMRQAGAAFPFTPRSSAVRWLRERSQYLAPGGLWLRGGSILLLGVVVNLLTLAPVIFVASFIIALYGRFRLTDLLQLPRPSFDPLFVLGVLLVLAALRSLFESLLQSLMWPVIMQMEWEDRDQSKQNPAFRDAIAKRVKLIAAIVKVASPIAPLLSPFAFVLRPSGIVAEIATAVDLWMKKDWRTLRQTSLRARKTYRHDLEWVVMALVLFGFLELQPFVLRAVHAPPPMASGFLSIELWTAVLSLAAAVASILTVNGAGGWAAIFGRVAPYAGAVLGPLSLYMLCLVIAERLLFDVPRNVWTGEAIVAGWTVLWSNYQMLATGVALVAIGVAAYVIVPWIFFELNDRSIHGFYRDSLGETFVVGESAAGDLEPEGDLKLSDLNQNGSLAPYQLINATLNLQADPALRNRGRHGDFFLFTRDVYGSDRTGYAAIGDLERCYGSFTAASAMATSGAAASPHMGIFSRRSFVLVMSLLNIRLGCWLPTPRSPKRTLWRPNPFWLFREMFGLLHARSPGLYLSDGGHLDNTGLYQLLKRRCRVIIAVDATTDPRVSFECLADLKRYARVDLGVEIHIDTQPLKLVANGLSSAHWTSGEIVYPATASQAASAGKLFLIKSSLTGDEDVETQAYRARAPLFPHEPLSDQFFDEGQFEAYSLLGFHAAAALLQSPGFTLQTPEEASNPQGAGSPHDLVGDLGDLAVI